MSEEIRTAAISRGDCQPTCANCGVSLSRFCGSQCHVCCSELSIRFVPVVFYRSAWGEPDAR
jgi:hypothetical protein